MASALLVQKEVSSDEYTIKTRKNEGKNTVKTSVKMILERVALTGKTQKPDRKIETRKGYEEYFLCSPASMFLRGLSNLFCIFAHTFSARAIVITHIVSDWLFSPCCVEHQDEFIFERVAVAYSRDYNEVGRAQIKPRIPVFSQRGSYEPLCKKILHMQTTKMQISCRSATLLIIP